MDTAEKAETKKMISANAVEEKAESKDIISTAAMEEKAENMDTAEKVEVKNLIVNNNYKNVPLNKKLPSNPNIGDTFNGDNLKDIYFAGGCFWGVEAYMERVAGVYKTTVGYGNGNVDITNPSYKEVSTDTNGFAETVHVVYDPEKISLEELTRVFFKIINPTIANRQGNDVGKQYRTGIYYTNEQDKKVIDSVIEDIQKKYSKKIVTENLPLVNYYLAEDYHQHYLDKNPNGYCHISFDTLPN